jgi:hypothetical protein
MSAGIAISLCILSLGCQQGDDSETAQTQEVTAREEPLLPPIELLVDNCRLASHAAIIVANRVDTVDRIRADDGAVGYIVERTTARIIKSLKGEFSGPQKLEYYAFLEYSRQSGRAQPDSLLVFLHLDSARGRFMLLEAGQFRYSPALDRTISNICTEH